MAVKKIALATTAQFETRHGVASGVDTTLIEQVIDAASKWIENAVDRRLKARNYNGFGTAFEHKLSGSGDTVDSEDYLYFDGDPDVKGSHGGGIFFLPAYPILLPASGDVTNRFSHKNAITFALEELQSRTASEDTWQALTRNIDYFLDQQMGHVRMVDLQEKGIRNYRIAATLGYSIGTAQPYVDDDLRDLCLYIAGKLYREEMDKKTDRQGSSDSTLLTLEEDTYVQNLLSEYRRL